MKKLTAAGGLFCSLVFMASGVTGATPEVLAATPPPPTTITVQETPPPTSAPGLIVSSMVGSSLPDYIELFNQADEPINLAGWNVEVTVHDSGLPACADQVVTIPLPSSWILSKKYLTLQRAAAPDTGTIPFSVSDTLLAGCTMPKLTTFSVSDPTGAVEQAATIPAAEWSNTATTVAQHKQRANALSSTRSITGIFDTDYKLVTGAITLNSDPLYVPPANESGLQITEILPNARSCSPLETDPTCNDYVKLFNPTDTPINLGAYRLRVAAKGQSDSVTNAFSWGKVIDPAVDEFLLPPQTYFMLTTRNDGQPLSITDSGNYVWLEDAYGTTIYEPVIQYPDASSTTKIGWAWAYTGSTWQWTSAPRPGAANYFPPPVVLGESTTATTITSILKPCAANQYRNPDTNRCNTIAVAATALASCDEGEERNPATNRCRSIVTTTAQLTPCQPGSERSPDTNRCRKIVVTNPASTVKDIAAPSVNNTGWFVAALAILLAASYGVYEWRQEIQLGAIKLRNLVAKLPQRLRRHDS